MIFLFKVIKNNHRVQDECQKKKETFLSAFDMQTWFMSWHDVVNSSTQSCLHLRDICCQAVSWICEKVETCRMTQPSWLNLVAWKHLYVSRIYMLARGRLDSSSAAWHLLFIIYIFSDFYYPRESIMTSNGHYVSHFLSTCPALLGNTRRWLPCFCCCVAVATKWRSLTVKHW